MLKVWNMVLVALAFELSIFGTFLTRSGVINSIHSFAKSSIGALVPRLRRRHDALLDRADPLAAAAAAREDEARVAALARGDVPLQQPAARRALPDDPLGRDLPDPDRALPGPDADDRPAVLRLLPAHLRAAAAPADGHRPADRLAADSVRALLKTLRWPIAAALVAGAALIALGCGLVAPGPDRLHASARSCSTTIVVELVRGTRVTGLAVRARRAQPPPLRRLRRARVDRAARDRHRRLERRTQSETRAAARDRAVDDASPATRSPTAGSSARRRAANAERDPRRARRSAAARRHAQDRRSTTTSTATRRARSGSTRTGCAREDIYVIFDQRAAANGASSSRCS